MSTPYLWIQHFSDGLDTTRNRLTLPDNSLVDISNAIITRGGDIQQQKAWVKFEEVSKDSFWLGDKGGQLFTFGSKPNVDVGDNVTYQQLTHPDDPTGEIITMTEVTDSALFDDKFYIVAKFSDGNVFHYNGGELVDQLSEGRVRAIITNDALASRLSSLIDDSEMYVASNAGADITVYRVDGEDFDAIDDSESQADNGQEIGTIKDTIYGGGAGDETRASTVLTLYGGDTGGRIKAVKVNGSPITANEITWDTDITTTLGALRDEINAESGGYTASVAGVNLNLKAPVGRGSRANGDAVSIECDGAICFNEGKITIEEENSLSSNFTFNSGLSRITDNNISGVLGTFFGLIVISGSASNDGTYTVTSTVDADTITVAESLTNETVNCTITEDHTGTSLTSIEISDDFSLNRPVLDTEVFWNTDTATTATDLANNMNDSEYTFFASGPDVWFASPNITTTFPGGSIATSGDLEIDAQDIDSPLVNFSGGVDGIPLPRTEITLTVAGSWSTGDFIGVSLVKGEVVDVFGCGDIKTGVPEVIQAYDNKMYGISENTLLFSGIRNASVWQPLQTDEDGATIGAGNLLLTTPLGNSDRATSLEPFLNYLAIGFSDGFQLWDMDNDPILNTLIQQPQNIGTDYPQTLVSYGDVDAFLLSDSGVRSLRSVNSTNTVNVMDPGLAIDEIIVPAAKTALRHFAKIEPEDNRYMLFLDNQCFPFSLFYGADIQGWSRFELPFNAITAVKSLKTLAIRGSVNGETKDFIYYYGGTSGEIYSTDAEVSVETPFYTANDPVNNKLWVFMEILAEGRWDVECAVLFKGSSNVPVWENIGTIENTSFILNNIPLNKTGTAIALRLKSETPKCRLAQIGLNFRTDGEGQGGP